MARKTVLVCDSCGNEVDEAKGAVMRVTYTDARRGAKAGRSLRRLRRRDAGTRCRPPRPQAEVRDDGLNARLETVPRSR